MVITLSFHFIFTYKKDLLCIDLDLQPKAPQKKPRQLRQKFPAAPNSVKKRKVKAGVSISDTLGTVSTNPGFSGETCNLKDIYKLT